MHLVAVYCILGKFWRIYEKSTGLYTLSCDLSLAVPDRQADPGYRNLYEPSQDCIAGALSSKPNNKISVIDFVSLELPKWLGNWLNPADTTVTGYR